MLNGPFKTVLLLLPPHPKEKVEIFQHWQEILLDRLDKLEGQLKGTFRIIDLPDIM